MSEDTWFDPEVEEQLEKDANKTLALDTPELWGTLEEQLDQPGWRDAFVSQSTGVRRVAALTGLLLISGLLVGLQGIRNDLDTDGWLSFAMAGGVLLLLGSTGSVFALRSEASRPLPTWPWIPLSWVFLLVWASIGPWPGMTGVPAHMHLVCFGATSAMVGLSTLWMGLLDRSRRPVPWRLGLLASSAGAVAFVAQGVFCPGVDVVHLVVGHGGAAIVGGALAVLVALGVDGLLSRRSGLR